jgi:aminopeptidase YwaD
MNVECAAERDTAREDLVRRIVLLALGTLVFSGAATAQKAPLLPEKDVAALANELNGETAKRNLEGIARFHRQRGSQGFHAAAELVAERAQAYGLSDVAILQFPADGKIFYGTQRSRPAWDAEFAELWEVQHVGVGSFKSGVVWDAYLDPVKVASYEAEPIVLAEDSESADVTAELVDVGEGTKESDYAGKDVKGKIVLVSAQPGAVQDLAVGKFGAAGIVSFQQNQKTAWWGEEENLIRWGHLETFSENKTFAFMVSLKTARAFRVRLAKVEKIRLHAVVKAGQHPGNYEVVTATIPGADPKLKDEEIAFSCHLDHQRPGANDNASGCVTILEVARTLQKLIANGTLARPARTIRFIWPPEIEGTMALLNAKPEFVKRIKAVVHMDMVGGGPETKAVFHVTRGPMSLPSFVHDVAWAFAEFVNEESYKFAATGKAEYPFVAPEGGKEPLRAEYSAYTMGSDHDVYQDSSFGIPAIYLNDWPDRYIHTNFDAAANIDTTKLKRAAFIGAASALFLAGKTDEPTNYEMGLEALIAFSTSPERRKLELGERAKQMTGEKDAMRRVYDEYEMEWDLRPGPESQIQQVENALKPPPLPKDAPVEAKIVFRRAKEPKGPLAVFGYDYFAEHAKAAGVATPKLLSYQGLWGSGEEYAYEALNFVNGKRNTQQVRDAVTTEYGPVPLELVVEYLKALGRIGVVEEVK